MPLVRKRGEMKVEEGRRGTQQPPSAHEATPTHPSSQSTAQRLHFLCYALVISLPSPSFEFFRDKVKIKIKIN